MSLPPSVDDDYRIWMLIHQVTDVILKARERELRQYGITGRESAVLFIVQAFGGETTPAEISRWLFREHHSVSALLNRMERKGIIKRTRDKDKKNMWRVSLTEKGQNAYQKSLKRESVHATMSALSKSERQRFESSLRKVRDHGLKCLVTEPTFPFP